MRVVPSLGSFLQKLIIGQMTKWVVDIHARSLLLCGLGAYQLSGI